MPTAPGSQWLFCFAVQEEATPFRRLVEGSERRRILVTGMGGANARRAICQALDEQRPAAVVTCGFAGGLNPELAPLTVVFDTDTAASTVSQTLIRLGARPVTFLCAPNVLSTVGAKRTAREKSGADAAEMESGVIREVCRERSIPAATVRVISDAADEPLPLDLGALMTRDYELDYWRLVGALAKSPGKIGELMRFRKRIMAAAGKLAEALSALAR